ncbi:MAG: regulatory protein RecX, regulatory protein [Microgenomates group bacterium GW2011_GWC1_39_7b]|uniref:Regulatory protein RecX n=3 Tax=Candidatus Woeseibacteriota TaxID=1752722 RepID=A0A0G0P1M8_9BACT|nr:MAG: Regulatory protein RecX [Candidatus Woesebacteria bacterium GW2011_GWB1_39_10]KKR26990.1 MAG: regulatory protein RecX, regulatory protein [Microgenomates group bacterium GW2011_GWC1_39_7b]KKR74022.1 MAG: Regulatory protein RecX [Candidatus Woesebacteria bacterium GW2011_GWA2_40_7]KKS90984.1 MAG: Regulatory protein RecX [Candidatus Woesebacteria bacterium GW2011_GWA1_43_12]
MPIITSIKQQKAKNRVNVYLDDKFGFGIDLDNFVLLHLKVDQELTEKEVEEVVKKAEFQKTLDKLLRFATLRPRSEKEVTDYFRRKKVHESMWEELLSKLKHFELLDDLKFAKWWVDQRQNFKPKPTRILKIELTQKGIVKEIIENVLDGTKVDEEKMAKELIERKMYKWKNLEPRIAKQKMSQYLAGKGFGWSIVSKVVGNELLD